MTEDTQVQIEEFLNKYIRSVSHLEVFLLLAHDPKRQWRAEEISLELRTNPAYADTQLSDLLQAGLVLADQSGRNFSVTLRLNLKKLFLASIRHIPIAGQWLSILFMANQWKAFATSRMLSKSKRTNHDRRNSIYVVCACKHWLCSFVTTRIFQVSL